METTWRDHHKQVYYSSVWMRYKWRVVQCFSTSCEDGRNGYSRPHKHCNNKLCSFTNTKSVWSTYSATNRSATRVHAPNTCLKYMPQIQKQEIEKTRQEKEAHHEALRAAIYSEASQQLKTQLDHMSRAGAFSWLSARPVKESDLHLSKSDFCDLIRLRYLLSLENMLLTCVCDKDYTITHALTCATGGFNIQRHNDVRDYLAHLLNQECADVSIEPHLVQVTEDETTSTNREDAARLDIAARDFWRPSQRAFLDIRVLNANAQSNISWNNEETFSHHEREKARHYCDRIVNVEHGSFTPLIFSTHGD